MIDTNVLLSVAFSLIASFTNVVQVPPSAVPQKIEDVEMYAINPNIATALIVRERRSGVTYSILRGAVQGYGIPGSYFSLQDFSLLPRFGGESKFTTNEALELATKTLLRLAKHGDPFDGLTPRIRLPSEYHGKKIPFLEVSWPYPPGHFGSSVAASVEIDGRNGQIVDLRLYATNFYDFELDKEIQRKVYKPDKTTTPAVQNAERNLPHPGTNQALQVIQNAFEFCRRFDLESSEATNLAQIDWDRSVLYFDRTISPTSRVCRISFTNSAIVQSVQDAVYDYFGSDAFFVGIYWHKPEAAWAAMQGTITKKWQDLAANLQSRVEKLLETTAYHMPKVVTNTMNLVPDLGSNGMTRVVVEWHIWHDIQEPTPADEFPLLFTAEFDLRTGQTKFISFHDRELIQAVGQALAK